MLISLEVCKIVKPRILQLNLKMILTFATSALLMTNLDFAQDTNSLIGFLHLQVYFGSSPLILSLMILLIIP
jgi:hypothetical protein